MTKHDILAGYLSPEMKNPKAGAQLETTEAGGRVGRGPPNFLKWTLKWCIFRAPKSQIFAPPQLRICPKAKSWERKFRQILSLWPDIRMFVGYLTNIRRPDIGFSTLDDSQESFEVKSIEIVELNWLNGIILIIRNGRQKDSRKMRSKKKSGRISNGWRKDSRKKS